MSIELEKALIEKQRKKIKKLAKAVLELREMKDCNESMDKSYANLDVSMNTDHHGSARSGMRRELPSL